MCWSCPRALHLTKWSRNELFCHRLGVDAVLCRLWLVTSCHAGIAFFRMQVLTMCHSRVWLQLETSCEIVEPLHCVEPEWSCRRCTVVHISWQWLLDSLSSACVSVFVCRPDQCCVGLTAVDLCVFVAVDPSNVTMKLMLHQKSLHSIWSARGRSDCWRENVCSCCPPVNSVHS